MAGRPRHVVRWVVLAVFVTAFAAQCAVENWPNPAPGQEGTASQRVLDLPGYSSSGSLEDPADTDADQVSDLLNQRADAVLSGDKAMFMRTVDTEDKAFVAAQRVVFANTQELPLAGYSFGLGKAIYPDKTLHTPSYVADVTISYQLDGYDAQTRLARAAYAAMLSSTREPDR